MNTERSVQQTAVLWVVGTACIVFIGGAFAMAYLAVNDIAIPDQLDRLVQLAAVGALALLGRTTDTKQEAKEAAEKMVNDLAELVPVAPQQVQVVNEPDDAIPVEPGV